jgi:hypothetical protein
MVAASIVYQFVAEHFQQLIGAAVVLGVAWLAVWFAERKLRSRTNAISAASIPLAVLPRLPPSYSDGIQTASLTSPREKVPEFASPWHWGKEDDAREASIRITPLIDTKTGSAKAASVVRTAKWVRPGESITVGDISIDTGLFYLGSELPSDSARTELCLINPSLPVARSRDPAVDTPGYYPSYTNLNPAQRRLFLEWMASGRRDPGVDISYVFVFFYGLEYRLFKQGATADASEVIREVDRLIEIYGTHRSFLTYASRLISSARLFIANPNRPTPKIRRPGEEMSVDVRVFLGGKVVKREPITSDDALLWAAALPNVWLRSPVIRCKVEFESLWPLRFAARYPHGLQVTIPRTGISATYRAASGTFEVPLHGDFEMRPDVASDAGAAQKIEELVHACSDELNGYSRLLGRKPEMAGKPRASLLLPEDLWLKEFDAVRSRLATFVGDEEMHTAPLHDVLSAAQFPMDDASSKDLATVLHRFSLALAPIGIGVEPDGGNPDAIPSLDAAVCLFKTSERTPSPAAGFQWRIAVDVALAGAAAVGLMSPATRSAVAALIATGGEVDAVRRRAYAAVARPPNERLSKLLKASAELPLADRLNVARCAVAAMVAGGMVPPPAVRYLERLYKILNFPIDELYSALHRREIQASVPAIGSTLTEVGFEAVRKALEGAGCEVSMEAGDIVFDAERLARVRESTRAVAKMLDGVFVEDAATAMPSLTGSPEAEPKEPDGSRFPGLDGAHSDLLVALLGGPLPRDRFESLAKRLKLLADGAIEHINEWAFDRFNEPVIDDGDTVSLAPHLYDHIKEMAGTVQ